MPLKSYQNVLSVDKVACFNVIKKKIGPQGHRVKYGLDHWTLGPVDYFLDYFLDHFLD